MPLLIAAVRREHLTNEEQHIALGHILKSGSTIHVTPLLATATGLT